MTSRKETRRLLDIVASEITPSDTAVAAEIFNQYLDRTRSHIRSVQEFAAKVCELFAGEPWTFSLAELAERHDYDKLHDDLFMAHYAPYIVKKFCAGGLRDSFDLRPEYIRLWDTRYVVKHCMKNGHHPEHWDATYNYGENHPPYDAAAMTAPYLAEMVCDWFAVGREQGNSAMDWFRRVDGRRYLFTAGQRRFIRQLIGAVEGE